MRLAIIGNQAAQLRSNVVLGAARRFATLAAAADATILSLDYARFRRFLLAFPQTALDLLGTGIGRLLR